ncbi:MAG: hypothetical protein AB7I04_02715 [Pseudomonadales bacterium]
MRIRLAAAGLVLALVCCATASARQVLVKSYANAALEVGQGYLTHYDGTCYLLTPTHVLAESGAPAALLGEGADEDLGETVAAQDLKDDVSVARVSGTLTGRCGYGALSVSRAVGRLIRDNGIATVRSVNGDGTIAQFSVSLFDDDGVAFLRLQPTHGDNQLRKGLSGSMLMVGDTPVAMLLSVDARFGVGTAIRIDTLLGKFDRFVRDGAQMTAAQPPVAMDPSQAAAVPAGSADWIPGPVGLPLELLEWNALPVDAAHRPTNLVAGVEGLGWQAAVSDWPVVLEFGLGAERVAIGEVRLEAGPVASALPTLVEVFVSSTTGSDRWRSVASGSADFSSGTASFLLAPTWARKIRLVIGASASPPAIGLHRVRVLAAP